MSARDEALDRVRATLSRAGYAVSERAAIRPVSFDLVARRDKHLIIVKVLTNIDAFDRRVAEEMRTLARFLEGTPLLIGERSGSGPMEDGVLYLHHRIHAITHRTLEDHVLEDAPPFAFAAPGGLYVHIEGTILRQLRKERALSLGILAEMAGVTRRTIQMYEDGMRATVESALRLEEFLKTELLRPVDPFAPTPESEEAEEPKTDLSAFGRLEKEVFRILRTVGFEVVPTGKSPFAALSREKRELILTGINEEDFTARRRAKIMASLTQVTERRGVFVVRRETTRTELEGTPIVSRDELLKVRDPSELHRILEDRTKRRPPPSE